MPFTNFPSRSSRLSRRSSRPQFPDGSLRGDTLERALRSPSIDLPPVHGFTPQRGFGFHAPYPPLQNQQDSSQRRVSNSGPLNVRDPPDTPASDFRVPQQEPRVHNTSIQDGRAAALRFQARLHEGADRTAHVDEPCTGDDPYAYKPFDPEFQRQPSDVESSGFFANLRQFYEDHDDKLERDNDEENGGMSRRSSATGSETSQGLFRNDSMISFGSQMLDPDDPLLTGIQKEHVDDEADLERSVLKQMDYRSRRKERMRMRIEFNVSCEFEL